MNEVQFKLNLKCEVNFYLINSIFIEKMENQNSASNMVLKELNGNSSEKSPSSHQPRKQRVSKNLIQQRSIRANDSLKMEENHLQSTEQTFNSCNKQNNNFTHQQSHQTSNLHLHTLPDQKNNTTIIRVSKSSSNQKKRSVIVLQNLLQNQPYVKKLMEYLPPGNFCLTTIMREKHLFSVDAMMLVRGEEMLQARRVSGCFSNCFQIVSHNLRENVLGCVKANASGSLFNVFEQNQLNQQKLVATICYEDRFSFKFSPRSVQMYVLQPGEQSSNQKDYSIEYSNLKSLYEQGCGQKIIKLRNRLPQINQQNEYCMDFGVNNILPSVKNVILEDQQTGKALVKFYKVNGNQFQLKIRENISVFLGYCFALSSLTFKLACQ